MDQWSAATEMHALSRTDERPLRDDLRSYLLLELRNGLVERAADVSALQAKCVATACAAIERVDKDGTSAYVEYNTLVKKRNLLRCWVSAVMALRYAGMPASKLPRAHVQGAYSYTVPDRDQSVEPTALPRG